MIYEKIFDSGLSNVKDPGTPNLSDYINVFVPETVGVGTHV